MSKDYKKINEKLAKTYFFLLVVVQLILILFYILFYPSKDVYSILLLGLFLGIIWPIALGLSLIKYYSRKSEK